MYGRSAGAHADIVIDLISASIGGEIQDVSDEFFAPASSLLCPAAPIQKLNTYVSTGAWYDGWETRRHNNKPADTCLVKLGVKAGKVMGVEIDTAFFNGNHPEAVMVEGCLVPEGQSPSDETKWSTILPKTSTRPSARHAWLIEDDADKQAGTVSHVRLHMYPDGGIARFRLYGRACLPQTNTAETGGEIDSVDLASCLLGGRVVAVSNERFGRASNLLLPGRGPDMGDGWETARSRDSEHEDWAIIRLACPGILHSFVVDTKDFKGNFPREVRLEAIAWAEREDDPNEDEKDWIKQGKLQGVADTELMLLVDRDMKRPKSPPMTHVKVVMVPDGGIKRVRVIGSRAREAIVNRDL